MWHGAGTDADWFVMALLMVAVWGGLAALVVWLVRDARTAPPASPPQPAPSASRRVGAAEDLLAQRFARGEIDAEEFTRTRALLRSDE